MVYNTLIYAENYFVGGITIHPLGLQKVEEDEWIMTHVFLSQLIMLFFPLGGVVLNPLVYFDKAEESTLSHSMRKQIFVYYRQCIQRHLYARSHSSIPILSYLRNRVNYYSNGQSASILSKDKVLIFLSKNPPFTMRLESLYQTFPNCRVACLLRDPLQSVPSMISYIAQAR
jgi:hypothetical protein